MERTRLRRDKSKRAEEATLQWYCDEAYSRSLTGTDLERVAMDGTRRHLDVHRSPPQRDRELLSRSHPCRDLDTA